MAPFASERELCDLLKKASTRVDSETPWTFYPELGGWDAVLVLPDGEQVGVQAKLRPNIAVVAQSIVGLRARGPDVHAVLVPRRTWDLDRVCAELDVAVLVGEWLRGREGVKHLRDRIAKAPRHHHLPGRLWLPPYVPDLPAGVPNPRVVSPWKVAAATICAELRAGRHVTAAQIKDLGGGSMSTWRRWLTSVPGTRRPTLYRALPFAKLPDVGFPDVCAGLGLPAPT